MKNSRAPKPVVIAAFTAITIVLWIAFSVIRAVIKPEPVDIPEEILRGLDPNLDTAILSSVTSRGFLNDSEIGEIQITPATPIPVATETATVAPESSPSPEATAEGSLVQ